MKELCQKTEDKTKQVVGGRPPRYASAPPPQVENIFVFIRQVATVPACWLFKTSATSWPLTFWPWNWCPSDVDYLCAKFSLPRPLWELGPMYLADRRQTDRQTDVRQKHRLVLPPYGGGGIIIEAPTPYRLSGTRIVECLEIINVGCNLKKFDGLTWLTLNPIFYDRSTPMV